jgi:hypothetical protein
MDTRNPGLKPHPLCYDLGKLDADAAMPKTAEPWSLKLIKVGAKVSHGRYVTFFAISRPIFADMLRSAGATAVEPQAACPSPIETASPWRPATSGQSAD